MVLKLSLKNARDFFTPSGGKSTGLMINITNKMNIINSIMGISFFMFGYNISKYKKILLIQRKFKCNSIRVW